ncbi:hypothetical protein Ddye_023195 [Dipteronia dyeriana]|uniref:Uncharacterized protein n=1 Tax=Dipteronia dyeriana TaxID=168575 RepID=A0AAD9WT42_9ROSI|nr:hypothetical protein Ddye_023195 [Dipteronia dyeriana]
MMNPRVFFDLSIDDDKTGRIVMELFTDPDNNREFSGTLYEHSWETTPLQGINLPLCSTQWLDHKQIIFCEVVEEFDILKAVDKIGSITGTTSKVEMVIDYGLLSPATILGRLALILRPNNPSINSALQICLQGLNVFC